MFNGAARLRPGVTLEQAQAEMDLVFQRLADAHPDTNKDRGIRVVPCVEARGGNLREMLVTLLAAVGFVLFIACSNVANLLLTRATARQGEISVRAALGATRGRLVTQLLGESMLLALFGGLAGALFAIWGVDAAKAAAAGVPGAGVVQQVQIDWRILAVALGLAVATGVVFGLTPAWLASRTELSQTMKQGSRSSSESAASHRLRSGLIVVQVACALVLLTGAGLFMRSFLTLASISPGIVVENTTVMRLDLPATRYGTVAQRLAFTSALLERVRALPGVGSAAMSGAVPFQSARSMFDYVIEGRPPRSRAELPQAIINSVSPEFFQTTGIALHRGRVSSAQDHDKAPRVLVIYETLAREQFPNEDPIGQRLHAGSGSASFEIIGIVADTKDTGLDRESAAPIYVPSAQGTPATTLIVRHTGAAAPLQAALKAQVYAIDRDQPITMTRTMADLVDETLWRPRIAMQLLGALAVVALLISAGGLYGIIAYSVSRRTTEIGIRMALGATTGDTLRNVLARGARLIGGGLLVGLAAAFAAGRIIQAQLFQTSSHDPVVLGLVVAMLAVIALVACWLPARHATQINPVEALRAE